MLFDGNPVSTRVVDNSELKFTVPSEAVCGPHAVQVQNGPFAAGSNVVAYNVTTPCQEAPPSLAICRNILKEL